MSEGGVWKPRGTRFQPQDGPSRAAGVPGGGAGQSGSEGPPAAKRRKKTREQKMDVVGEQVVIVYAEATFCFND